MASDRYLYGDTWLEQLVAIMYYFFLTINLISLLTFIKYYNEYGRDKIRNSSVALSGFGGILSFFCHSLLVIIFKNIPNGDLTNPIYSFFYCGTQIVYATGNVFVYLVFILRVKVTFERSVFRPNNNLYYIGYSLTATIWLVWFIASIYQWFVYANLFNFTDDDNKMSKYFNDNNLGTSYVVLVFAGGILDLILTTLFIGVFIQKLFQLITLQSSINTGSSINNINNSGGDGRRTPSSASSANGSGNSGNGGNEEISNYKVTIHGKQIKLINFAVKTGILSFTAVISTTICMIGWILHDCIFYVIMSEEEAIKYERLNTDTRYIAYIIMGCDTCINSICMLLSFSFLHKLYKNICVKCHRYWRKICIKKVENKARKDMNMLLTLQLQTNQYVQLHTPKMSGVSTMGLSYTPSPTASMMMAPLINQHDDVMINSASGLTSTSPSAAHSTNTNTLDAPKSYFNN